MNMTFPTKNFTNNRAFTFTVGRGQQHSSALPSGSTNSDPTADLLGGAVLIPEDTVFSTGMAFSGTSASYSESTLRSHSAER